MLFCLTSSAAFAQSNIKRNQQVNSTPQTMTANPNAAKQRTMEVKDRNGKKASQQVNKNNTSAQRFETDAQKRQKEEQMKKTKYTRAVERVTRAENRLSEAEENKNEAQMAYVELQQSNMLERQELEQRHANERLAGVTEELIARQECEMKQLEAVQARKLATAQRAVDKANKKYQQAIEEYNRARSERQSYE